MSNDIIGSDAENALSSVGDALWDTITGVPSPIRKSAIAVFTKLIVTAVEYPITLIANSAAERKAESIARIKLTEVTAEKIAENLNVSPEFVVAAGNKLFEKIVRQKVNLNKVVSVAAVELSKELHLDDHTAEEKGSEVSDDWLNAFENEAANMTSEHMQLLFGKILAGEIKRPTTYSIRTIKLAAQLDNEAAQLFVLLCSVSVALVIPNVRTVDAMVLSFGGNAGQNSLAPYGLNFSSLNVLEEYGFIIPEYNSTMDYQYAVCLDGVAHLSINYQGELWQLHPMELIKERVAIIVNGVKFTKAAKELWPIVSTSVKANYSADLEGYFARLGYRLLRR